MTAFTIPTATCAAHADPLGKSDTTQEVWASTSTAATVSVPCGHWRLMQAFGSVLGVNNSVFQTCKYVCDRSNLVLCEEYFLAKHLQRKCTPAMALQSGRLWSLG